MIGLTMWFTVFLTCGGLGIHRGVTADKEQARAARRIGLKHNSI